ncbi:hypothetical protein M2322_001235 [Rhodoblastus acidophilus]|nr:hypothetical protein [Rhodoblastus acidophilus]
MSEGRFYRAGSIHRAVEQPPTYYDHPAGFSVVTRMVYIHGESGGHGGVRAVRLSMPRLRFLERPEPQMRFAPKPLKGSINPAR